MGKLFLLAVANELRYGRLPNLMKLMLASASNHIRNYLRAIWAMTTIMTKHETRYHKHLPVLLEPSVTQLVTDPGGVYIDATLGGGGHSQKILSLLNDNGQLIGIDQDDQALAAARSHIGPDSRFTSIKGN